MRISHSINRIDWIADVHVVCSFYRNCRRIRQRLMWISFPSKIIESVLNLRKTSAECWCISRNMSSSENCFNNYNEMTRYKSINAMKMIHNNKKNTLELQKRKISLRLHRRIYLQKSLAQLQWSFRICASSDVSWKMFTYIIYGILLDGR